jgi:hypothetical protein
MTGFEVGEPAENQEHRRFEKGVLDPPECGIAMVRYSLR